MLYVANDELSIVLRPYPAYDTFLSGFNISAYFTRALLLLWIPPCKIEDCDIPLVAEGASPVFYMAIFAWLFFFFFNHFKCQDLTGLFPFYSDLDIFDIAP